MFDQTSSNLPLLQSDSTSPLLFLFLSIPIIPRPSAWVSHFSPKRLVFCGFLEHTFLEDSVVSPFIYPSKLQSSWKTPPPHSSAALSRRNFCLNSSIAASSIPPSQPSDCPKAKEGRYLPTLGRLSAKTWVFLAPWAPGCNRDHQDEMTFLVGRGPTRPNHQSVMNKCMDICHLDPSKSIKMNTYT